MKAGFTAIIEAAPVGGCWANCPEIPGANGQGETIEETKESLRQAIELILEDRRADRHAPRLRRRHQRKDENSLPRASGKAGGHKRPAPTDVCDFAAARGRLWAAAPTDVRAWTISGLGHGRAQKTRPYDRCAMIFSGYPARAAKRRNPRKGADWMKRADLERKLRIAACYLRREGNSHTLWINP